MGRTVVPRGKRERGEEKKKSVVKTKRENAVCVPLSATGDLTSDRVGQESHQDVEPFPKHTSQSSTPRVIESNPEPRAGANQRAAEGSSRWWLWWIQATETEVLPGRFSCILFLWGGTGRSERPARGGAGLYSALP